MPSNLGLKTRFLDDAVTLNIAAFYEEFSNFQVLEFTGTAFQTFNVPVAESKGVEIEGLIRPNSELTFNVGATILEASYPADCAGNQTVCRRLSRCAFRSHQCAADRRADWWALGKTDQ